MYILLIVVYCISPYHILNWIFINIYTYLYVIYIDLLAAFFSKKIKEKKSNNKILIWCKTRRRAAIIIILSLNSRPVIELFTRTMVFNIDTALLR